MTAKDPLLSHATNSQNGKNNYGSNTTAESLSSTSSLINTTKMKAAFLSIRKLGGDAKQKTLLEKAAVYREQNPSVWAKKCQEKEKKDKEYHEIYSPDPFLEEYYQQIDDIENEEKRKKKLEKSKSPTLVLQLVFKLPGEKPGKPSEEPETHKSLPTNLCTFHREDSIFDVFKSDKNEERGLEPELTVTAIKAKYLQNNLRDGQKKYISSRLKCSLIGDNGKRKENHKTDYLSVTNNGKARWNQTYMLRGYSPEDLKTHFLVFKVTAKTEDESDFIGEYILAGESTSENEHGFEKSATSNELLQRAIQNPGETVDVVVDLQKESFEKRDSKQSGFGQALRHSGETKKNNEDDQIDKLNEKSSKESDFGKKLSGLKRMLPRKTSNEESPSNHERNKLHGIKGFFNDKNFSKSKKSSDEPSEGSSRVTSMLSRLILHSNDDKEARDETSKLPPSSKMKVTAGIKLNNTEATISK